MWEVFQGKQQGLEIGTQKKTLLKIRMADRQS